MEFAYLQGVSLIDYPGKVAAVLWTVGCNLRCPFCYNAELVLPELGAAFPRVEAGEVLSRLQERAGFLDGVVVSGGEPTLHPDLPSFLREVKGLGLLVKLDTNGTRPEAVRALLATGLVDYVALDVKAPFSRYAELTGLPPHPPTVRAVGETMALIRDEAPDYEFRTTVAPGLEHDDLVAIARQIRDARHYVLQPFFVPKGKRLVDETWRGRAVLSVEELRNLLPEIEKLVPVELRG